MALLCLDEYGSAMQDECVITSGIINYEVRMQKGGENMVSGKRKLNVGIDLGTTYSAVSYYDPEKKISVMLPNSINEVTTPSVVYVKNGEVLIGKQAKLLQSQGETDTAAFYKCMMGNLDFHVYLDGQAYNAEDLSAMFLKHFVEDIEKANNIEIKSAVITVPAYFNHVQRKATMNAGQRAGLRVMKIINEPTAAIIAYGLADSGIDKTVLVYDLGGGTFDITIAHIHNREVEVIVTAGNHDLGGKNWDMELRDYLCRYFYEKTGVDIGEDDEEYYAEILVQCEEIKRKLTEVSKTFITLNCSGHKERIDITREDFDRITGDLLMTTMDLMKDTVSDAGKKLNRNFGYADINEVVLVGGSTMMPQVYEYLSHTIPAKINRNVDVNCIVSQGASIQAYICDQESMIFGLPAVVSDVTSHSLGIVTVNEARTAYVNTKIINQNTPIPAEDNRLLKIKNRGSNTFIEVYVTQGEVDNPEDCVILGKYTIKGFGYEDASDCLVQVTYQYDDNGIVHVSANQVNLKRTLEIEVAEDIGDCSWMSQPPQKTSVPKPLNVCILLDASGSMSFDLEKAADAARAFMNNLPGNGHLFTITAFADEVKDLCHNTQRQEDIEEALLIYSSSRARVGICNDADPLRYLIESGWENKNMKNMIVVLTDGEWEHQKQEIQASKTLKDSGVLIHAVGIADADEKFLKRIASSDGAAIKTDASDLVDSFEGIAQSVSEDMTSDDDAGFQLMAKM